MTRLLIRSGKDPFTPVVAESTLTQDVFNSNSGNYLFQHSMWKALSVDGAELVSNGDAVRAGLAASRVTPPASTRVRPLRRPAGQCLPGRLRAPARSAVRADRGTRHPGHRHRRRRAGTARPRHRGARDPSTRRSSGSSASCSTGRRRSACAASSPGRTCSSLGFPDDAIDVIGCPSLFLHGRDFRVDKAVDALTSDSPLALNLTPEVPGIGAFATAQAAAAPEPDLHRPGRATTCGCCCGASRSRTCTTRWCRCTWSTRSTRPTGSGCSWTPGPGTTSWRRSTSPTAPASTATSRRCSAARPRTCWRTTPARSSSPSTTACRTPSCRRSTPT